MNLGSNLKFAADANGATDASIESETGVIYVAEYEFNLVKKKVPVTDSLPWVRCASGNVFLIGLLNLMCTVSFFQTLCTQRVINMYFLLFKHL